MPGTPGRNRKALTVFSSLSPNLRGMLAMTFASITFVFSDTLSKIATQSWSVAQVLTVRGVFAILIAFSVVVTAGEGRKLRHAAEPLVLMRSAIECFVAMTFISALALMPLADLTSILMLSPLAITALATLFFGEEVGWRRWSAILVGFLGLLLVVQPGQAHSAAPHYAFAAMLGLVCVIGVAMRDIVTKRLSPGIPSVVVMFGTAFGSCLAGILLSAVEPWFAFDWKPLLACMAAAAIVTLGNFFVIFACRGVELSAVAPYRYSAVLWSILMGYFVFGDRPNWLSVAGMGTIVASGLYLMHRERLRAQEIAQTAQNRP